MPPHKMGSRALRPDPAPRSRRNRTPPVLVHERLRPQPHAASRVTASAARPQQSSDRSRRALRTDVGATKRPKHGCVTDPCREYVLQCTAKLIEISGAEVLQQGST